MIKKCLNCKSKFTTTHKDRICCSRKCSNEFKYPKIFVKCSICNKDIARTKSTVKKNNYCSNKCRAIGVGIHQSGENNPNFKNANTIVNCDNCHKQIKILNCNLKNSDGSVKKNFYCSQKCKKEHQKTILLGENNPNFKGGHVELECSECSKNILVRRDKINKNKNFYCSQKCKKEHQKTILLGENNPFYNPDLSVEHREKHRLLDRYNEWRLLVYKRDNFTCKICGDNKGGNLNAHHLDGYNVDVKNRTNVNNGVTLCEVCHKSFHVLFGFGNNTKKQFEQFINLKNNVNTVVN